MELINYQNWGFNIVVSKNGKTRKRKKPHSFWNEFGGNGFALGRGEKGEDFMIILQRQVARG